MRIQACKQWQKFCEHEQSSIHNFGRRQDFDLHKVIIPLLNTSIGKQGNSFCKKFSQTLFRPKIFFLSTRSAVFNIRESLRRGIYYKVSHNKRNRNFFGGCLFSIIILPAFLHFFILRDLKRLILQGNNISLVLKTTAFLS